MPARRYLQRRSAFTLIEMLVVVSIIALLMALLLPSLAGARRHTRGIKCLAHLHVFGQGMAMYADENRDMLVPGRLPKVDNCNWFADLAGRRKFRPTFVAMMSPQVGVPPFADAQECGTGVDRSGEMGDRQDFASPLYVCPQVSDWTDERNGSYGYNYQFLGNSRLFDAQVATSFKNWPVRRTAVQAPVSTVAVADGMGTAAAYAPSARGDYDNNARDGERIGNEGFNLDPPLVDPKMGEMCDIEAGHRSAADPRHAGRSNVLWCDGHADAQTLRDLGYREADDGSIALDGSNLLWTPDRRNLPWRSDYLSSP